MLSGLSASSRRVSERSRTSGCNPSRSCPSCGRCASRDGGACGRSWIDVCVGVAAHDGTLLQDDDQAVEERHDALCKNATRDACPDDVDGGGRVGAESGDEIDRVHTWQDLTVRCLGEAPPTPSSCQSGAERGRQSIVRGQATTGLLATDSVQEPSSD